MVLFSQFPAPHEGTVFTGLIVSAQRFNVFGFEAQKLIFL